MIEDDLRKTRYLYCTCTHRWPPGIAGRDPWRQPLENQHPWSPTLLRVDRRWLWRSNKTEISHIDAIDKRSDCLSYGRASIGPDSSSDAAVSWTRCRSAETDSRPSRMRCSISIGRIVYAWSTLHSTTWGRTAKERERDRLRRETETEREGNQLVAICT